MGEYQYRVKSKKGDSESSTPVTDAPQHAGELYKNYKKNAPPGSEVTLQKRRVGDWETVEKETT